MQSVSKRSMFAGNPIEEDDAFAEKLARSGKEIIKLNRGDPVAYFPTPGYIIDAYRRALDGGKTGYSFHAGVRELRDEIARRHKRLYNLRSESGKVVVTQGVSESIMFMNSILINPGDSALVLTPYYPLYVSSLRLNGGIPINVRYSGHEGQRLDPDLLRKSLKGRKRVKYIIFSNPSNPAGSVMTRDELKDLAEVAKDHGIFIISDEIYDEIVYNGARFTSISEVSDGIPKAIFGGASKCFDATGFRIGYTIIPGDDKMSSEVRDKLADYAKMRLSSNTTAQYALAEGIRNRVAHNAAVTVMTKEIEKRANFACSLVNESEYLHVSRPNGAFYIFPKVSMGDLDFRDDGDLVRKLLVEEGVQITRGSGFGSKGSIRMVTLSPKEILEASIRKIDKFLVRHSR